MALTRMLFPGQQENEQVYLVIREHWFNLLGKLLLWAVFIVILFALDYYVPIYVPNVLLSQYIGYYNLFKDIYLVFLMLGLLIIWSLHYLNYQIITDQRIVDVTQAGLFSHTVSELGLDKIEDVTSETNGFFGTVFSYGNVLVQTAGTEERFTFQNIPHPDRVEKLILDLYQKRHPTVVRES